MSELTTAATRYIEQLSHALLITVDEENRPATRYIGPFIYDGLDIYFMASKDSRKVRHISRNPVVTLYFQDISQTQEAFKSVIVSGQAAGIPEGNEFDDIKKKFSRKSEKLDEYLKSEAFNSWTFYRLKTDLVQFTDFSKSIGTEAERI
jgi:nitroimidazol reductase NimA-like FMN-containing flavoprotein (pyridoxamine 5'-phosphate oxidase superfamily)